MARLFANNALAVLAAGLTAAATTLTVVGGQGARFPSPTGGDYFLLTLVQLDSNGREASWEIVRVNARDTDSMTIVRAQEGTTAAAFASGTGVELRLTAGTVNVLTPVEGATTFGLSLLKTASATSAKSLLAIAGSAPAEIKTASFVATAGGNYAINSAAGSFAFDMVPNAPAGTQFSVPADYSETLPTNPVTAQRNGSKFFGKDEDFVLDMTGGYTFEKIDETYGWTVR